MYQFFFCLANGHTGGLSANKKGIFFLFFSSFFQWTHAEDLHPLEFILYLFKILLLKVYMYIKR